MSATTELRNAPVITRSEDGSDERSGFRRHVILGIFVLAFLVIPSVVAQGGQGGGGGDVENKEEKKADPDLDRLKREKEWEETQLAIDKARAERLRAQLPKGETKALEGKTSVDDYVLPGSILAYASAAEIAKQLAKDIKTARGTLQTIIVYNEKDFGAIAAYHSVLNQARAIQAGYENNLPSEEVVRLSGLPAALLAPELVTTVLRSVADLVALFRTDVEIKGFTVTVEEVAVIAELARAWREMKPQADVKVIYTPAYLPAAFLRDPTEGSDLAKKLSDLFRMRRIAGEVVAEFEALTDAEKKAHKDKDKIPPLKALNEQTDKLSGYLSSIDEKTGLNPLTLLLKAESLNKKLAETTSAALLTKVHVGAGSNKTTRNLFTGSKLYHNGGAVITFVLLDPDGAIGFSKTYFCATKYTMFERPETWEFIHNF